MKPIFIKQSDQNIEKKSNTGFKAVSRIEEHVRSDGSVTIDNVRGFLAPIVNEQGKLIDKNIVPKIVLGKIYRGDDFESSEDFIPDTATNIIKSTPELEIKSTPELEIKSTPELETITLEGSFGKFKGQYIDVVETADYLVLVYDMSIGNIFIPPKSEDSIIVSSDFVTECVFRGISFEVPKIQKGFIYFDISGVSTKKNEAVLNNCINE